MPYLDTADITTPTFKQLVIRIAYFLAYTIVIINTLV